MAKEFAKKLYNSCIWGDVRQVTLMRDKYLCHICGNPAEEVHHIEWLNDENIKDKDVAIGQDNLMSLCKNCHFDIHKNYKKIRTILSNKNRSKKIVSDDDLVFDDDGYLIEKEKTNADLN